MLTSATSALRLLVLSSLLLTSALPGSTFAQKTIEDRATEYEVGVAKVDITPDFPIRLNGFLMRKEESQGVRQQVWAKALAIGSDQEQPAVLITVDTLGIPAELTAEIARRVQKARDGQPIHLAITASHSHTAPMINGCAPNIFGEPIPPDAQAHIDRYTQELTDKLETVALAALRDRRGATLHWGIGEVTFAKNRRDKQGPFDHDLPLLVVRDPKGEVRAIYVSYACHCVTLSEPKIGGDWAGYAQQQIEKRYPHAVAMVSIGCAGDQNPSSGVMGDRADLALGQGEEIAVEVDRLLAGRLRPVTGSLTVKRSEIPLDLQPSPSREKFEELAKQPTPIGYHARVQLAKLDRGERLRDHVDYPVHSWSFGDSLAMVFLAGEVVSEYGLRIKSELDGRKVWVNAYANACPCYIPSEKVLKVGGYEGGGAMIYYDQPSIFAPGLEQQIIDCVLDQLKTTFPPVLEPGKGQGTRPRAPEQSLKHMRTHGDLQVDLVVAEPLVTSPVAVDFGPDGKVWVAEMFDYPSGTDGDYAPAGRVRLLQSSKDDGVFDSATVFLDGIPFPTGVTVWRKGILVCAAPDILYAEDTDDDGRADVVRKLFSGFGTDNYQARVNSLEYGLDGWVYGSCGLFGGSIKSFARDEPIALGDRDFRIHPDTGAIEPAMGRTQQGRVRDDFGNWFGCNNSALCFHYPLADHYMRRNPAAPPPPGAASVPASAADQQLIPASDRLQLFKLSGASGRATAACGLGIYRDTVLGEAVQGNAFTCEPVNLLVHRLQLSSQGSTFIGKRPADEASQEFLASTDTWFRPVQARTAPDGSLWILDMYRFVIEHPRWIPSETLAEVDVRAGSSLGRIYRVRPRDAQKLSKWPRLDRLTAEQLVAALDTTNGWQRDMAMQMLVWNSESTATDVSGPLRELSHTSARPEVRLQALATLGQIKQATAEDVVTALNDPHPGVRSFALTLAEKFASADSDEKSAKLLPRVIELTGDANGQVRLQAACSLGSWQEAAAAEALARMVLAHGDDPFAIAAVLSSLRGETVGPFVNQLCTGDSAELGRIAPQVLPVAISLADRDAACRILDRVASLEHTGKSAAWQWTTLASLIDRIERQSDLAKQLAEAPCMVHVDQAIERARELVRDETTADAMRIAAAAVLSRRVEDHEKDLELLSGLLTPRNSAAVQQAAVAGMLRGRQSEVAAKLLEHWAELSPSLKATVLDGLLSRDKWTDVLLSGLERSQVSASELDATRRQRLLGHADAAVKARAERVLSGSLNADRQQVLSDYASVATLTGDVERGRESFRKNCSTCHRLDEMGTAVGPDLQALSNKPAAFFLQEILDPNRNLDSRYMSYTALTDSGRIVSGLLAAETATAITLRGAEGKEETLERGEIERLSSTRSSLMPEGLERLLRPQDVADIIHFVQTTAAPVPAAEKSAAGELARDILNDSLPQDARERMIPATLKSAAEVITAMAANMPEDAREEYRRIPWIWRVAIAAGKTGDDRTIQQVLECSVPREGGPLRDWQAVVIGGGIINGLSLRGEWPRTKLERLIDGSATLKSRWPATLDASKKMADNNDVRSGTRYDALRIVALEKWPDCREQLERYLGKDVNAELQMGSVSGLADVENIAAAQILLDHLPDLQAGNRRLAIAALARNAERQHLLLDALKTKKIEPTEVAEADREKLLNSDDREIAERAKELLSSKN